MPKRNYDFVAHVKLMIYDRTMDTAVAEVNSDTSVTSITLKYVFVINVLCFICA